MKQPLIAIVGDISPNRTFDPPLKDAVLAKKAAEQLGAELAIRGARLLVYGGPFLESDVVRGFVAGKPAQDRSILMWYSKDQEPPAFPEETDNPKLFQRKAEKGADWETAFYRSIATADGVILMGGGHATLISGQVAIGTRIPLLAMSEFGGGASKVWNTLSAGEDLPNREEIDIMAQPWNQSPVKAYIDALYAQIKRRDQVENAPNPFFSIISVVLFITALSIVPLIWGQNQFPVWMLFLAPVLSGGAGASIRPIIDRVRGTSGVAPVLLATIVLGLVAGGIAGVLFITAQLTADPQLAAADPEKIMAYARRSIPFAVAVGFIAGLTSDVVFNKLLGLDVIRTSGLDNNPGK